jgi:CRP-like cAMP-binding protein
VTLEETIRALRRCPLFAAADEAGLKLVALAGEALRYRAGEALVEQGEESDSVFVILAGEAEVRTEGAAEPVARLAPGAPFGEIGVLCDVARTATVRAAGDVEALRLPRRSFLALLEDRPETALALARLMAERLRATTARLATA